jgi:O-antigen/teichoic acid export membrane protein
MQPRVHRSFGAGASSLLASMVTYCVVCRMVSPTEYGRSTVVLSTLALFGVAFSWCGNLMLRYGPEELSRSGSLRVSLSTRLVFTVPPLLLLVPAVPAWFGWVNGWSPLVLCLSVLWLLGTAALGVLQPSASAAQRFGALALSNLLSRGTPALVILALALLGRIVSAEALIAASVGALLLATVLLLMALRPLLGLARPDRQLMRAMWRYSLPSLIAMPWLAIMNSVDPLILRRSTSDAEVGRYQLAYLVITLFATAGTSFNGAMSPVLVAAKARGDRHVLTDYAQRVQTRFAIGFGLLAFAAAPIVAPLGHAILPARWAGAADTAAMLTVAGGLTLGVFSFHPLVMATDSVWTLQAATILSGLTNLLGDLFWAPHWGAKGIAMANVAAWLVHLLVLALGLNRRIGARRISLFPLLGCGALVLAALFADAGLSLRLILSTALAVYAGPLAWRAYRARTPSSGDATRRRDDERATQA